MEQKNLRISSEEKYNSKDEKKRREEELLKEDVLGEALEVLDDADHILNSLQVIETLTKNTKYDFFDVDVDISNIKALIRNLEYASKKMRKM